jgi:hypothetical protein
MASPSPSFEQSKKGDILKPGIYQHEIGKANHRDYRCTITLCLDSTFYLCSYDRSGYDADSSWWLSITDTKANGHWKADDIGGLQLIGSEITYCNGLKSTGEYKHTFLAKEISQWHRIV